MRAIADATHKSLSHTAVHMALVGSRGVPSWATVYAVVQALGGDAEEFRELWVMARDQEDGDERPGLEPQPTVQPSFPLAAPRRRAPLAERASSDNARARLSAGSAKVVPASRREIVEYITNASPHQASLVIKALPMALTRPVLNSLHPEVMRTAALAGDREVAERLLGHLDPRRAGDLLGMLPPSLAVDAMASLPATDAARVLCATEPSRAAQILAELRSTASRAEVIRNISASALVSISRHAHVSQNAQILPGAVHDAGKLAVVVDSLRASALRTILDTMPMADLVTILGVEMEPQSFRKLTQCLSPGRLALALGDLPSTSAAFLLAAVPRPERQLILNQVPHRTRIQLLGSLRVAQRALLNSHTDSLGLRPYLA